MTDFESYIRNVEPNKRDKASAWETAIGLQFVDGLQTSNYLKDTAIKHIEGDISIDDVKALINSYYQSKEIRRQINADTEEADKVSANIAKLLNEKSFAFSLNGFTSIHRRLFENIYKFAGKIRDYDITKKEWVLGGDTVLYVNADDLSRAIEYDLDQEKNFSYRGLSLDDVVVHIAKFISNLWQIHPFGEGNTRTTAVFAIKYLRSIGFNVDNKPFAENSWYFRNALVRANYRNVRRGIEPDFSFLILFFRNLMLGENNVLKNRNLVVNASKVLTDTNPSSNPSINPSSNPSSSRTTENSSIVRLIRAIATDELTVKEILSAIGLRNRENFMERSLKPAIKDGLVTMLYPDKPRHPRQKYLLTTKGLELYNSIK